MNLHQASCASQRAGSDDCDCRPTGETALERAEREELERWGSAVTASFDAVIQEQEDRRFVLQQALMHYVADFQAAGPLGEVAARRLVVARKLLKEQGGQP